MMDYDNIGFCRAGPDDTFKASRVEVRIVTIWVRVRFMIQVRIRVRIGRLRQLPKTHDAFDASWVTVIKFDVSGVDVVRCI